MIDLVFEHHYFLIECVMHSAYVALPRYDEDMMYHPQDHLNVLPGYNDKESNQ